MTVSFKAAKANQNQVILESKQGVPWRISPSYDFQFSTVQSSQDFLNYLLNFAEHEDVLVPYLGAFSQHKNYKTLNVFQQFCTTVADALLHIQEPIEKTRLYQSKLCALEGQTVPEKKAPITIALINAFRQGANANLAPLVQPQIAPAAPKGPSPKLQTRLAMVRNLTAKPTPAIPAPPAAKAPEPKKAPLNPPLPPPPLQNGGLPPPPPPPPNGKQVIAKASAGAPPVQPLKPSVQAVQAPAAPAAAKQPPAAPLAAKPAPIKPQVRTVVSPKTKPRENRLLAMIKKPFIGIKNLLSRLLQLFRGKKARAK